MCKLFTGASPRLYATRVRSIRLGGVVTSIRLENIYWQALEEIGARDGLSVPRLISRLHEELAAAGTLGDRANFTSFLRVSCTRYLQLQVAGLIPTDCSVPIRDGLIPTDCSVPIRELDSQRILAAERAAAERTVERPLAA